MINCLQTVHTNPILLASSSSSSSFRNDFNVGTRYPNGFKQLNINRFRTAKTPERNRSNFVANGLPFPVDPWSPTIDSQSIASQLFAFSLFPYIGFLYFITRSNSAPKLTLFGFYFLLAFVGATVPAGIYAKVHYGTSLSNVDWLHGGAESLLTLTNLFIVIGLRQALRKVSQAKELVPDAVSEVPDDNTPST
ncbi:hypothetical protein L1987_05125 [Smallanthus sonchifolius]|uniref:Uncharacterized protein n=1 Tax=Smallanthus sonchifolius TaxID=185202 RepID=A0ACB9JUN3_9ASTR|nr:hypothetical protein L1987_05125 [Smallanthus sonchifolius]